jgi:uncharacterized protein (TIGR03000 family)
VAVVVLLPSLLSAGEDTVPTDKALLVVRLPANAVLTIGDAPTRQTGTERLFLSPALEPGKSYRYELVATWEDSGKPKTVTRFAGVKAGQRTVVDFAVAEPSKPTAGQSRTFLFTYSATVTGLTPGAKVRIWLPVPPTNEDQEVKIEKQDLPGEAKIDTESEYGNKILYVEGKAGPDGTLPLSIVYRVTRREIKGETDSKDDMVKRFLKADRLVPVEGKPIEEIVGKLAGLKCKTLPKDQNAAAKMLYDAVDDHMKYSKEGTGWGRGDSVWACDSKYGNCTDFHSLFISLARANKIPAKFEIGFGIPEKHGSGDVAGYHCWAKFRPEGKNWIPVDISEANKNPAKRDYYFGNLTEDRVAFSTGRDITLTPKQDGDPLNFFVYPYVEVDGKAYPAEKVQKKFRYEDVK